MKKILICTAALLFSLTLFAQESASTRSHKKNKDTYERSITEKRKDKKRKKRPNDKVKSEHRASHNARCTDPKKKHKYQPK